MKPIQRIAVKARQRRESVRARDDGSATVRALPQHRATVSIRTGELVAVLTVTNANGRKATTTCGPEDVEACLAKLVSRLAGSRWF